MRSSFSASRTAMWLLARNAECGIDAVDDELINRSRAATAEQADRLVEEHRRALEASASPRRLGEQYLMVHYPTTHAKRASPERRSTQLRTRLQDQLGPASNHRLRALRRHGSGHRYDADRPVQQAPDPGARDRMPGTRDPSGRKIDTVATESSHSVFGSRVTGTTSFPQLRPVPRASDQCASGDAEGAHWSGTPRNRAESEGSSPCP